MKLYRTLIPTWTKETGDTTKEAITPEYLTSYSLYDHEETGKRFLFAIGGKPENGFSSNWDLYIDDRGTIYSIAREGSTAHGTYYGDKNHIKRLIREGHFSDTLTEYGQSSMSA